MLPTCAHPETFTSNEAGVWKPNSPDNSVCYPAPTGEPAICCNAPALIPLKTCEWASVGSDAANCSRTKHMVPGAGASNDPFKSIEDRFSLGEGADRQVFNPMDLCD